MDRIARRTPIHRLHATAGAVFASLGEVCVVERYDGNQEFERAARLALADLSTHPRMGVRGPRSVEWLESLGMRVPSEPNRGTRQDDGTVALRLSQQEFMVLPPIVPPPGWQASFSMSHERARHEGVFLLPRSESHGWLVLTGELAPEVLAKLCGVDMRLRKFANGTVAQTSVARIDGVVARSDLGTTPCFSILSDACSTEYLWGCLLDSMQELDGAPVGVEALARHANSPYQTMSSRKSV
jgi:sarcosine oxidase, subunit gamma